ncbi:MAG: RNA-binding transcriptional accessory protein [Clostridia bacterium]|nr:RNA-binding transcriptional accessory protein [Clostridia bacterium]
MSITNEELSRILAVELTQNQKYVLNVINLIDEGNTIPFIARYRKEAHGSMDDTVLRNLDERLVYLRNLEDRKDEIIKSIDSQGKLTDDIRKSIYVAKTLSEVEDIYRPFKQKRRTRATVAKEKGLEPLALYILSQLPSNERPEAVAKKYIDVQKGVSTVDEALAGASDIIAEMISDSAEVRKKLKILYTRDGVLTSVNAKDEDSVYSNYYAFQSSFKKMQGHQVLALNRGEKEGFLKVKLTVDENEAQSVIERCVIQNNGNCKSFLVSVIKDAFSRLLEPSVSNEMRGLLTEKACEGAIKNFAVNLKPLLMQPPVKGKNILALDPGYRMGCKVAVIDSTGKVLDTTVVYPTHSEEKQKEAIKLLSALIVKNKVSHIAIGNGTASRETEIMTAEMLKNLNDVSYMVVSEAGASVYSASKLAAEEFPQFDVNLRSAVSIARRMQDPLAELVKIDPKAIGVGQYQHDMPQKELGMALDAVVEDCVNSVGVDLNTASASLLERVSGLNSTVAKNIVSYREENGAFSNRKELKKVPKLGPKAFEQCAGFLRIPESKNVLDNTGVHPESYDAVGKLCDKLGYKSTEINVDSMRLVSQKVKQYGEEKLASEIGVGVPTLQDIIKELQKPGRDPRNELPAPIFRHDLLDISDLKEGMVLTGTVRNVIDFGAFIDIGVHQDGLVHISEIVDRYIKHPSEVLSIGEEVKVKILSVDVGKKRIALSIKQV